MKTLRKRNIIAQARERVSIVAVLRDLGVDIPSAPEQGIAIRVYCPFGEMSHEDQGRERQMRVYVDNTAWCFDCNQKYDPVSLTAIHLGCNYTAAARRLLDRVGGAPDPTVSVMPSIRAGMVAALGVWADVHGVDRTAARYGEVLRSLDALESEDQAQVWLTRAKGALSG